MSTRLAWMLIALGLLGLAGCENDCQRMCREFASIYEECDESYGDTELKECLEIYRIPDQALLQAVCEYGMQAHPEYGSVLRADMIASSSTTGDDSERLCSTLEDWGRTVGSGDDDDDDAGDDDAQ